MVRSPAKRRGKKLAAKGERPGRAFAGRVHEQVRITGRVRQIIEAAVAVHPRAFEVPPRRVAGLERLAVGAGDHDVLQRRRKLQHVRRQARDPRAKRRLVPVALATVGIVTATGPALQLALIGSGSALNGPSGRAEVATPMRKTPVLSFAGK